jgi:hypothetical protein
MGRLNDRRARMLISIIPAMAQSGVSFFNCSMCFDGIRFGGRVGSNIPLLPFNTTLEVHRIIPWILHEVLVVSLRSSDPVYDAALAGAVTFTTEEGLGREAIRLSRLARLDPPAYKAEAARRITVLKARLSYLESTKASGLVDWLLAATGAGTAPPPVGKISSTDYRQGSVIQLLLRSV